MICGVVKLRSPPRGPATEFQKRVEKWTQDSSQSWTVRWCILIGSLGFGAMQHMIENSKIEKRLSIFVRLHRFHHKYPQFTSILEPSFDPSFPFSIHKVFAKQYEVSYDDICSQETQRCSRSPLLPCSVRGSARRWPTCSSAPAEPPERRESQSTSK